MESMLYNLFIAIVLLLLISMLFWLIIINLLQMIPKKVKNTEPIKRLCVQIKEQQAQDIKENNAVDKLVIKNIDEMINNFQYIFQNLDTDLYVQEFVYSDTTGCIDSIIYTDKKNEAIKFSTLELFKHKNMYTNYRLFPCPVNE